MHLPRLELKARKRYLELLAREKASDSGDAALALLPPGDTPEPEGEQLDFLQEVTLGGNSCETLMHLLLYHTSARSPANALLDVPELKLQPGEQAYVPVRFDKKVPPSVFRLTSVDDSVCELQAFSGICQGGVQEYRSTGV